jgi:hypothetical protein
MKKTQAENNQRSVSAEVFFLSVLRISQWVMALGLLSVANVSHAVDFKTGFQANTGQGTALDEGIGWQTREINGGALLMDVQGDFFGLRMAPGLCLRQMTQVHEEEVFVGREKVVGYYSDYWKDKYVTEVRHDDHSVTQFELPILLRFSLPFEPVRPVIFAGPKGTLTLKDSVTSKDPGTARTHILPSVVGFCVGMGVDGKWMGQDLGLEVRYDFEEKIQKDGGVARAAINWNFGSSALKFKPTPLSAPRSKDRLTQIMSNKKVYQLLRQANKSGYLTDEDMEQERLNLRRSEDPLPATTAPLVPEP